MAERTRLIARRLPRDPGVSAWYDLLPAPDPAEVLQDRLSADVLIVGAGFAGLSAAARIAEVAPETRVSVLEARRLAEGPAGRNSGFMIDLPHDLSATAYAGDPAKDQRQIRDNRLAIDFAAKLAQEAGLGRQVFERCGKVNAAAGPRGDAHNQTYRDHLTRIGEASELLDPGAMSALTGSDYYTSGLFTPGAALIQPAAYIRGIAGVLGKGNCRIFENSPVLGLVRRGRHWRAETPLGAVSAPVVILALNGHANSFGLFARRLMHVFTYASMSRPLTPCEEQALGGAESWAVTPSDPLGSTLRKIATPQGARLLLRNRFTYDPAMEVSETRLARITRRHAQDLNARFPGLTGLAMTHQWGGRLCLSLNNVAAFGEVEDGLITACCHNGLGTTKGTFGGMMAADLALGNASQPLADLLAEVAPRRLPPAPFDWVGANARLRFGEYRAGAEL